MREIRSIEKLDERAYQSMQGKRIQVVWIKVRASTVFERVGSLVDLKNREGRGYELDLRPPSP